MRLLSRVFIFSLLVLQFSQMHSPANVRVSILNGYSVSAIVISPDKGYFNVVADGRLLYKLEETDILYVSRKGDMLFVSSVSGSPGEFEQVTVYSPVPGNSFSLRPVRPSMEKVSYHGNLELSVSYERISIINEVDENLYLAGVVEAEAGTGAGRMFYKAQSVICRTYLYGNLHRHASEGFDVCDEVHCQVYHGRLTGNSGITGAVEETGGLVIDRCRGRTYQCPFPCQLRGTDFRFRGGVAHCKALPASGNRSLVPQQAGSLPGRSELTGKNGLPGLQAWDTSQPAPGELISPQGKPGGKHITGVADFPFLTGKYVPTGISVPLFLISRIRAAADGC
jgi:hypothetical protein